MFFVQNLILTEKKKTLTISFKIIKYTYKIMLTI